MNRIITYEKLRNFTYSNDALITGKIKGLVIDFIGLGGQNMQSDNEAGKKSAEKSIIYITPYNNPWNWMNRQAISITDEIIDVLFDHYSLPDTLPIVSSGGSMGGQSAIVYCRYAKRTPVACVANCPVCDMPYHFTERPDLPRTMYSAFYNEQGELNEILKKYSPLHLAPEMPDINYYIFHCGSDEAVNKEKHSDKFVAAMKDRKVTYYEIPGRGHCDLGEDMAKLYHEKLTESIFNKLLCQ